MMLNKSPIIPKTNPAIPNPFESSFAIPIPPKMIPSAPKGIPKKNNQHSTRDKIPNINPRIPKTFPIELTLYFFILISS